jgi:hypothetical protein
MKILSLPDEVCFTHAVEFWTGLLAFARADLYMKHEQVCGCRACREMSAASLRALAIAAAGPAPPAPNVFGFASPVPHVVSGSWWRTLRAD